MGALRVATLASIGAWLFAPAAAQAAPLTEMSVPPFEQDAPDEEPRLPPIGFMIDAGLPDGVIGSVVIRPVPYTRLHVGAGSNTISPGLRGGLTILPVGEGPSLNLEVGHYSEGGTNALMRSLFAGLGDFGSYVRRFSYTFFNAHAGIELGTRSATFFVHGGFTYLRSTLHQVSAPTEVNPARPGRTTVTFKQDPHLRLLVPSAKVGLVVYLQ